MSKVGIILTPDIRSNAYLSKIINKKIKIGEIIFLDDIPVKVAINEAVDLAKKFGDVDSGRFVNQSLIGPNAPV